MNINTLGQNPESSSVSSGIGRISAENRKIAQLLVTLSLGIGMLYMVGFASMDIAHNAAHDTRHSHAFPCH